MAGEVGQGVNKGEGGLNKKRIPTLSKNGECWDAFTITLGCARD